MVVRKPIAAVLTMALLVLGMAAGCGDSSPETSPTLTPTLDARVVLEESAQQLMTAESIELEMNVSGHPVEIKGVNLDLPAGFMLLFKYARGIFQAPDRMNANIEFGVGNLSTTADLIALDRDQYFRSDILTANRWISGEVIEGFSPAALLSDETGIPNALRSIDSPEIVGTQRLKGLDVFELRGTIQASAVHSLTFGLVRTRDGTIQVQVYVDIQNWRLAQITLTEPPPANAAEDEPTIWDISILNYNQSVSITAPTIGSTP